MFFDQVNPIVDSLFGCSLRAVGFVAWWPLEQHGHAFSLKLILALGIAVAALGSGNQNTVGLLFDPSLLISEILFGIFLSLPVALIIAMIEWWAELFETGRGQNLGSILDPMQQSENSALSSLLRSASWVALLASPVILHSLALLLSSYHKLPVGSLATFWQQETFVRLLEVINQAVSQMLCLALPFATLFLLIEFITAVAGKLLPQVSLTQESFLIKTILGALGLIALNAMDVFILIQNTIENLNLVGL